MSLAGRCAADDDTATLVVEARVLERQEVWDRRSNPLMGRPDFLKEIALVVAVVAVRQGTLPVGGGDRLAVSFKGNALLAGKRAGVGWTGVFQLRGEVQPLEGLAFEPGTPPPAPPPAVKPPPVRPVPSAQPFPEGLSAHDVRADATLRTRAVRVIARRYAMTNASAAFLTSHSGPEPPPGGYQYWGVKGRIDGRWHVWQPGRGEPRPGTKLTDPLRYQK